MSTLRRYWDRIIEKNDLDGGTPIRACPCLMLRLCSVLRSEMSRAIFDAPMMLPLGVKMGETVSEISTELPSLRWRTVS
jgi:hypothetical protein